LVRLHGDQVRARAATTNPLGASLGAYRPPALWPQRDADLHRYGGMDKTVAVSGNVS
jgi:hypothetical protein